jgi:hypothetical protein
MSITNMYLSHAKNGNYYLSPTSGGVRPLHNNEFCVVFWEQISSKISVSRTNGHL